MVEEPQSVSSNMNTVYFNDTMVDTQQCSSSPSHHLQLPIQRHCTVTLDIHSRPPLANKVPFPRRPKNSAFRIASVAQIVEGLSDSD